MINKIGNKEDFIRFLYLLSKDNKKHSEEWENHTISEYLKRITSWIEDYSTAPANNIDWDKIEYKILAQIFYIGKIFELRTFILDNKT